MQRKLYLGQDKKEKKEMKNVKISLSITLREEKRLRKAFKSSGCKTMSDFFRRCCLRSLSIKNYSWLHRVKPYLMMGSDIKHSFTVTEEEHGLIRAISSHYRLTIRSFVVACLLKGAARANEQTSERLALELRMDDLGLTYADL